VRERHPVGVFLAIFEVLNIELPPPRAGQRGAPQFVDLLVMRLDQPSETGVVIRVWVRQRDEADPATWRRGQPRPDERAHRIADPVGVGVGRLATAVYDPERTVGQDQHHRLAMTWPKAQ